MKIQSRLHNPKTAGWSSLGSRVRREEGSTLLAALVTLTVLALIAASTFLTVTHRYRSNYQTASWHDALTSAEDGVQYALVRLRSPLTKTDTSITSTSSSSSSSGPNFLNQVLVNPLQVSGSIQSELYALGSNTTGTSQNGTVVSGTYNQNGGTVTVPRIQLPTLTIPHIGQGSSQFSAVVTVDAVPGTGGTNGSTTWYRIQSTGTVPLAGSAAAGMQKYDNWLRKLQFRADGKGNAVTTPKAVRTIEIIAKPVSIGSAALFGKTGINLNNQNVVIDSYDSRSTATSTNGIYDASKATKSANVVTDDLPTSNGTPGVINLSSTGAYVNGNIATNDTPVAGSTDHVSGTVTQDFYQNLPNPPDPTQMSVTWTTYDPSAPPKTDSQGNLYAFTGTQSSPTRYKINNSHPTSGSPTDLALKNQDLIIDTTGGGWVEIWIPGSLDVEGSNQINVPAGAHVTFYVDGNVSIAGNGVLNTSQIPGDVTFYGNPDPASSQTIDIAGNGVFAGILYAPNSAVSARGSGNSGDIFGAIIANTIFFNGTTSLHYDQALGDLGAVIDYRISSWYEDNTLAR
jgi:Tfp pilus assembly protein PilX